MMVVVEDDDDDGLTHQVEYSKDRVKKAFPRVFAESPRKGEKTL